ncbi:MAG: phosphodiester glycosidase family protein [Spirochaetota bacterium]
MKRKEFFKRILLVVVCIVTSCFDPDAPKTSLKQEREQIIPIASNDLAIQYPNEIPQHGSIQWSEPMVGFFETNVAVYFHEKLYDKIQIVKVDPQKYRVNVWNDPTRYTIEDWRKRLNALAVINASYYKRKPYGAQLTPILENGRFKGNDGYPSSHGIFLSEPVKRRLPLAKYIDFSGRSKKIKKSYLKSLGYKTAIVSYPILLDAKGRVRAKKNPQWRATRSFIGIDKKGYIVIGNTMGGFFSLYRLGSFLKSLKALDLEFVLNLDGGPPACMDIKANKFRYTNYGIWETNDSSGSEKLYWNQKNYTKWKIPNVISIHPK